MISLCMDSAYKALVLGLYKDGTLIDGVSIEAFKKQSETIFVELNQLFEKTGLDYKDVDEVIITDGPGSYTGIRIAMTIAKVFCTQMHKTLKCISTMQLFAGMDESANVILDARSKRAYVAHLEKGVVVGKTQILEVDQLEDFLNKHPGTLYGDGYLVNHQIESRAKHCRQYFAQRVQSAYCQAFYGRVEGPRPLMCFPTAFAHTKAVPAEHRRALPRAAQREKRGYSPP